MDRKVIILPNQTDHAVSLCILYDKRGEFENRPLEGMGGGGEGNVGGTFDSSFLVSLRIIIRLAVSLSLSH